MRYFFILALLLGLYLPATAQFMLYGRVTDPAGKALPGATIYLHELRKGVVTDTKGSYRFEKLRPGHYHLHTQYIGHEARTLDLEIRAAHLQHDIILQPSSLELREIIVESDLLKLDEKGQSQSVEVVGADQIRKNYGVTLMQSLERLPGINSINTGIGISKPVIRGLSFNRVAVSDQGIKQEGQQWGLDHGLEIDPFGVGRVEIIKGPAALLYGSDAIGGVVQVKAAPFPIEGELKGQVTQLYRSVNSQYGVSAELAGHQGMFVWRIRGTLQDYADYRLPADSFSYNRFRLPLLDRRLKNTAGQEKHGNVTLGVQRPWGFSQITASRFSQRIGYFAGALGQPQAYQLVPDGDNRNIDLPHQAIQHDKIIWNNNIKLGENWLEIDIAWQQNRRQEHSYPHAHGRAQLDSSNTLAHGMLLRTGTANARYHYRIDSTNRLILGVNLTGQRHQISGYEFLVPAYQNQQAGAFIIWQYKPVETWQWNAGLRYDYAQLRSSGYSEMLGDGSVRERAPIIDRNFGNISGSAGLAWNPHNSWQVKINVGSSYRIPTLPELSSNGVHHGSFRHEMGDPNLDPERAYQFDLGFSYRTPMYELKLSPYFNYFGNYIYLRPTGQFSFLPDGGQIFRYEQGTVAHTGAEVSTELHLHKALHLAVGGAYTRLTNLNSGVPLPFTPPFQGMLDAEYSFSAVSKRFTTPVLGMDLQLFAAQNRTDRNEWATPGYGLVNLHGGFRLNFAKQALEFRLMVNNIFDKAYFNHLSRYRLLNLPEAGRNVQIMLHLPIG